MKLPAAVLLIFLLGLAPAHASLDASSGSFFRTAAVPAWNAGSGTFTIMLWVYAPSITGMNNYFNADDGGAFNAEVILGSAADSPTEPYVFTRNGEWHFNRDGTFVANPPQSFDVSLGWTFLAISFTEGGANDLYAWQSGVNGNALVHIPVQSSGATIGGSGSVNTFTIGDRSGFDQGCLCYIGPVYVYDGLALTQAQVDAQRLQQAPVINANLIVYSPFNDGGAMGADLSGTADWNRHGSPGYSGLNPPPVLTSSGGGGGSTGAALGGSTFIPGSGSGGALDLAGLLALLAAAGLRCRGAYPLLRSG